MPRLLIHFLKSNRFSWVRPGLLGLFLGTSVWVAGLAPNLLTQPSRWLDNIAYAQNPPSASEIENYAKAVLQMEPHRRDAEREIRRAGGDPNIVCADVFSGLPGSQVAARYCDRAARIIEANGLSNRRFNQITEIASSNNEVQRQIQAQMSQLCRQPEFRDACS
ncbi:MAG: DUF4168 domain-containing protein [Cyanobacteria bacterium P01_G01_bin.54]